MFVQQLEERIAKRSICCRKELLFQNLKVQCTCFHDLKESYASTSLIHFRSFVGSFVLYKTRENIS